MFDKTVQFIKAQFPEKDFIPLHEPKFIGNERKYVLDCIDSTFVSSVGKYVDDFEKILAEYTGAKYAVACVNGTAALHMSLIVAGVKQNDLVITQALSFIATCNAISYLNATPLFVDVDMDTMGMSPKFLNEYLEEFAVIKEDGFCYHKLSNQKISACVPMHTFGHPCRIDEIAELCKSYNIVLVEDAAESIGSFYKGIHTGNFGKIAAFSFNGNKTITSGGGGAIITNDEALAKHAKYLTTQAKVPHKWEFVHDEIGYNYRMPNLNAAFLVAQMEQLQNFLENKRELAILYMNFFRNSEIIFVEEPKNSISNYWLNTLLLKDKNLRDEFLDFTNSKGVMTRPAWTLMTNLPMFKNCEKGSLNNSLNLESRIVNIPSSVRK